jgi:K+-transporting ATPase ATPase B chain
MGDTLAGLLAVGVLVLLLAATHALEMTRAGATFVEFTAQTRMSGVDLDGTQVRKGAGSQVVAWARSLGGSAPTDLADVVDGIARFGGTPWSSPGPRQASRPGCSG